MTLPNQSMKSWRSVNHLGPCILAVSLLWSASAIATENFAGVCHINTSGEPPEATASDWGPVQTDKASIANLSPVLLPFFNNGLVFGLPGTVVGDFWQNTQLTGDWGGFRTSVAEHGIFFDLYSTSTYQDVTSGGLKTGGSFVENLQLSINIDTGRAGLWPGGLFHFTVGSRFWGLGEKYLYGGFLGPAEHRTRVSRALSRQRYLSDGIPPGSGADTEIQSLVTSSD